MLLVANDFPVIEVCYTSNYVENEVVSRMEANKDPRATIVISKFTDLLKFITKNKDKLYMRYLYTELPKPHAALLFSVKTCQERISREEIVHPLLETNLLKFSFNGLNRREVYNLTIYAKTNRKLFYLIGYRWHLNEDSKPYEFVSISTHLLKTFFGLFIRDFLDPGDLETTLIDIYATVNGNRTCTTITPYEGGELDTALTEITSSYITQLFESVYNLSVVHELPSHYLAAIRAILAGVSNGVLISESWEDIEDELAEHICMVYLRFFFLSVGLFDEVLGVFNSVKMKHECTTSRL